MRTIARLLLLFAAMPLAAQITGSLTGIVTSGGRALPGVTVTATSPALQGARVAVTGEAGAYHFESMPPGNYSVAFELAGMQTRRLPAVLQLAQTTRLDVGLMSTAAETITVTAAEPAALETPEVSTNLPLKLIERLPVQRNQLASAQLAPGVTANVFSNGQLQISGAPGYDNLVIVDGVAVTENVVGQMRPMYVEDGIQETTVLTGAIGAEYGRFTGGVVNTISKSGGNETSGSLRDSLTNPAWSAQTPAGEDRPDSLNHVWEGTLGGYILRDRLWYFTSGRRAKNDTARQTLAIPAFTGNPASPARTGISYSEGNDQKRWEGKLTAQIDARDSLAGSYFRIDTRGTNARASANIYDLASLTARRNPESLAALHYTGVPTQNLLLEGHYARRRFGLHSGSTSTDPIAGTLLLDRSNNNARFNAPALCGVCPAEERGSDEKIVKAGWFLNSARWGSHALSAGADRFEEHRFAENHQSGSDYSVFVTRVQFKDGVLYPVITPTTANGGGTFIRWTPILVAGRDDHLRTDSLFVSDRWDYGPRWSVTAGLRYDRNHAVDADGVLTSRDHRISPRFSLQFDPRGDGRQRFTASYAEYTSRIADTIASASQSAGNAATIDFAYKGPAINNAQLTVPLPDVIRMLFDAFALQGGTANTSAANLRAAGVRTVPGYSVYFDGTLRSPAVRELTAGYGLQIGGAGFARVDLIDRDWHDFYAASVTTATRHVTTPLGIPVDLAVYRNSNRLQRTYRGVQLQARWNPSRFETGVHYTWSKLRGNDDGENATGPLLNLDHSLYYPEYFGYDRYSPKGWLAGDQRHRLRAWVGYAIKGFEASLLQTYDSGLPYSMAGAINVTRYAGAPANPGYNSIPNGTYFFSRRGEFRTNNTRSTNLALRYSRGIFFVQGDLLNVFNADGIVDPNRLSTTVTTAATSATLQPFNPYTETPVKGVHYQPAANFGQPLNDQAYQTPRTYRFSVGARF